MKTPQQMYDDRQKIIQARAKREVYAWFVFLGIISVVVAAIISLAVWIF